MNKGNELLLKILFLKVKKFGPIKYRGHNLLIFSFSNLIFPDLTD
jgi:hypothetical protein